MKRLTLIRHAKSSWSEPGLADFDRPLNERGQRDAPKMGKHLRKHGLSPDLFVSSPAKRALTTAQTIAQALAYPSDAIRKLDAVYEASLATLLNVVHELDDNHSDIVLFGHNPGITVLANFLVGVHIDNVPTCGVVMIELAVDNWRDVERDCGRLLGFDYPKKNKRTAN
ncbi:MAG: histidine phosphatase family protein [Pseudomonadota bacterium]|nr:MAG: histidine phosphatase family protein [Pseudomonadota bacterium]